MDSFERGKVSSHYDLLPMVYIQKNCPLCSSTKLRPLATEKNCLEDASNDEVRQFSGTWIQLLECQDCKFAFTKEIPVNPYFFDKRYDIRFDPEIESKTQAKDHIIEIMFKDLKRLGCVKGELLDIGSFGGSFMRAAEKKGFRSHGIEVNPTMAAHAKNVQGLDVINGKFLEIQLANNTYDLITLIDVLEHLTTPKAVLEKCFNLLKPGGFIMIKVPHYRQQLLKQNVARFFKISKQGIFENFGHINHFSPQSLSRTLETIGFEVLEDFATGSENWQKTGFRNHLKNMFRDAVGWFFRLLKKITGKNLSMNFTIIARKR